MARSDSHGCLLATHARLNMVRYRIDYVLTVKLSRRGAKRIEENWGVSIEMEHSRSAWIF